MGRGPEQITRELTAIYHPRCNTQQYDQSWKDEWIGEYSAPTTGPVSRHSPDRAWPDRLIATVLCDRALVSAGERTYVLD
jgi:hypothetical protein